MNGTLSVSETRRAIRNDPLAAPSNIELFRVAQYLSTETPSNGLTTESQRSAFIRLVRKHDQRMGQALMNVLYEEEYSKLSGSLYDPFYKNDAESCITALDWVTA